MAWRLKEDVKGFTGTVYGKRHKEVTVISDRDNILVVELVDKKDRFHTTWDRLEEFEANEKKEVVREPVQEATEEIKKTETNTRKQTAKKVKAAPKEQTNLFS